MTPRCSGPTVALRWLCGDAARRSAMRCRRQASPQREWRIFSINATARYAACDNWSELLGHGFKADSPDTDPEAKVERKRDDKNQASPTKNKQKLHAGDTRGNTI